MSRAPFKRWTVTGFPAEPESKRRGGTRVALPPRVRLHLMPGGVPLETTKPEQLRALAEDLERAAVWLETQAEPEPELELEAEAEAEEVTS